MVNGQEQGRKNAAVDSAPIDPARIAETLTLARWRAAEDRIYPLVLVDPELYQSAVAVVGRVCEQLRARNLSRAELLALDVEATAIELFTEADLYEEVTSINTRAGLGPTAILEAALAQVVSLAPLPSQE